MQFQLESSRLYFRPLIAADDIHLFELDSNPEVHTYLGKKPVTDIQQVRDVIVNIQEQYRKNGVGRMATIIKETGEFIGWAGLKIEPEVNGYKNFYDLGYRFMPRYWGKGYATEAAKAFIDYGFNVLKLEKINAYADFDNYASRKVLEKAGLQYVEDFEYEGDKEVWYEILNPKL
jgi:ribosomal-protein-alanine N-acetyltransferase